MDKETIKSINSMLDILARYSLRPDRSGFICCPFHQEKTASMKIYPDSFYCFGCGASGDIFTFIQKMENISFSEAFKSLGGTYPEHEARGSPGGSPGAPQKKETFVDIMRRTRDQKKAIQEKQREADREFYRKRAELKELSFWCGIYAKGLETLEPMTEAWCFCADKIDYAFYKHEELLSEVWQEVRRRDRQQARSG